MPLVTALLSMLACSRAPDPATSRVTEEISAICDALSDCLSRPCQASEALAAVELRSAEGRRLRGLLLNEDGLDAQGLDALSRAVEDQGLSHRPSCDHVVALAPRAPTRR